MGRPPKRVLLAGLIEQESCISLTHSRCWNPKSSLKTPREEGAGMPQITRAYKADGSLRFDALYEIRRKYPKELGELSWSNVYDRPDLQLRLVVLKMRDNYQEFQPYASTDLDAYAFADAAYNGGSRDVNTERRACKMSPGCDPNKWFGHVEKFCIKSKGPLYGTRSACQINREHVTNVMKIRSDKYHKIFQ
jgi:hypothetical protein